MGLMDNDEEAIRKNAAARVAELKKNVEKLQKILQSYAEIEHKYNGCIDFERCTSKELNVLITFVIPNSGLVSKVVPVKKGKFREKGITPDNIKYLATEESKKLTKLKLQLSNIEHQPAEHDGEYYEQEDDEDVEYICAEI